MNIKTNWGVGKCKCKEFYYSQIVVKQTHSKKIGLIEYHYLSNSAQNVFWEPRIPRDPSMGAQIKAHSLSCHLPFSLFFLMCTAESPRDYMTSLLWWLMHVYLYVLVLCWIFKGSIRFPIYILFIEINSVPFQYFVLLWINYHIPTIISVTLLSFNKSFFWTSEVFLLPKRETII